MPLLQFAPLTSLVQPSFWHELTRLKIDVLKLSDDALPIWGTYSPGRSVKDRETGQEVGLGCNLLVGGEAFETGDAEVPPHTIKCRGLFKNFNTVEEFKNADKTALFNQLADQLWQTLTTTSPNSSPTSPSLTPFLLLAFADLKKYKYYYWFAFPAFVASPPWEIGEDGWVGGEGVLGAELPAIQTHTSQHPHTPAFLILSALSTQSPPTFHPLSSHPSLLSQIQSNSPSATITLAYHDPSPSQNPGWPLRNILAYLSHLSPSLPLTIRVLRLLDANRTLFSVLRLPHQSQTGQKQDGKRPNAVGWEKNPAGKLAPRVADLGSLMDPRRLADQAVDLNLKLMRWRILPSLDLDKVANTKCLLLGAGTLGCYVGRVLMGWGVRTLTFVDSSRVSFSNPVRQPLFEFEDCLDGGKPKAECAAERLGRIFPGVNAKGHTLSVPMPGHPVPPAQVEQTKADVKKLEALIESHDAVFLLMDSRESRWLPTVLGAAKGKIVMNAALGFDTYLVMRHGAREKNTPEEKMGERLGCYYCNDIVAPTDSLTDRTLDQMCTVTRPGLASIAAATAVELLVSVLQHPDGVQAPAPPPQSLMNNQFPDPSTSGSVLGLVPHQLRGFLAQFRSVPITGAAYDRCTGCSEAVLRAYETEGFDMLLQAFNDQEYLERLTGLDKVHEEGAAVLESMEGLDWEEEEDE